VVGPIVATGSTTAAAFQQPCQVTVEQHEHAAASASEALYS
jgi:hypothetical protein